MQQRSLTLLAVAPVAAMGLAAAFAFSTASAQPAGATPPNSKSVVGAPVTPPPPPPPTRAGGVVAPGGGGGPVVGGAGQGAAAGFQGAGLFQCHPTYNKTAQYMPAPGQHSAYYECESPTVVQCPDKSAVRHPHGGNPATGMGIDVKAVPVGQVGDYNRYKIQYKCSYFWPQG
jgi:hypothetical protein